VTSRPAVVLALAAISLLAMATYSARNLELSSGMEQFLVAAGDHDLAAVSTRMADSPATRTMILSLGGPELPTAVSAAREWAGILAAHPEVVRVRAGPDPALARAVHELYFPRRLLFLSAQPESELPQRLSSAGLRGAARDLRRQLALPHAQLVQQVGAADPLLAFPELLRRFESTQRGGLRVVGGQFVDAAGAAAILFATTAHSAFDSRHQAPLDEFLERSFAELDERFGGALVLERSSVARFAVASERSARADMTRISAVSAAGIVVLFLLTFRSPRLLLISLLPLGSGILAAVCVGTLLFGALHLTTLVFGATLIGVCIDYPIHYLNHHTLLPGADPQASLRRVWKALLLGASTTVAGFAGLAWSDFPGIREIGVFSAVGVLAALLATAALLPPLAPRAPLASRLQRQLAAALGALLRTMESRRGALVGIAIAALLLCAVGLPRVSWRDDPFALGAPLDPELAAEDARVRDRVSQMDAGRFVVVLAPDTESALRGNDAVAERLAAAREAGMLDAYRSLHAFLWSADLQRRNLAAVAAHSDLPTRLAVALGSEGFRPEAFSPFGAALRDPPPEPLRLPELLDSPLADVVAAFHVELDDGVALLTHLRGVHDPEGLAAALAGLEGVHYVDQREFLATAYGHYRKRTSTLILGGLLAVLALLGFRYRSARLSLAAAAPAFLAAALTVALLALAGSPVGLLHMLGLLLVLSFGVDYGIFLLESRSHPEGLLAALLSIVVACASTCLAFGLLAVSSFPALRALGVTTGLGVLASLVLAPTVLVLAGPRRAAS
jgi:predicted exporter